MPYYHRSKIAGGTYFFTQVTHQRQPWLCSEIAGSLLRSGGGLAVFEFSPLCGAGGVLAGLGNAGVMGDENVPLRVVVIFQWAFRGLDRALRCR